MPRRHPTPNWPRPHHLPWLALLWALMVCPWAWAGSSPLLLNDERGAIDAWPAVTLLSDPSLQLSVEDVLAQSDKFTPPPSVGATLGVRPDAVWLRIPFEVASTSDAQWILDVNHSDLNHIGVYLTTSGYVVQQATLGSLHPYAHRPLQSRSHALTLNLRPGLQYELLVRIQTRGAMILPISFYKPAAMLSKAVNEQMLQGVLTGLALCLLVYSLGQWLSLRDSLFLKYALLLTGSLVFSLQLFGVGRQYVWGAWPWAEPYASGVAALAAAGGSFLFIEHTLRGPDQARWWRLAMRGGAAVCGVVAVAHVLDVLPLRVVTAVMITTAIRAAIKPYSMAVAPDSSFKNCVTAVVQFFMMELQIKSDET